MTDLKTPSQEAPELPGRWPLERALQWYAEQPWLIGCNYIPATAINQIEMWQAQTFDPATITKELNWAAELGFNTLRVYLHDLLWADDADGLYSHMDTFLHLCNERQLRPSFVFFDDCHRPYPKLGKQPETVPTFHNSAWMNSPARDVAIAYAEGNLAEPEVNRLKGYIQETLRHFKADTRILMWELYNEPGQGSSLLDGGQNEPIGERSAKLLLDAWAWAREVAPTQPICSTAEGSVGDLNQAIARNNSDIISFHCYAPPPELERLCRFYAKTGRPAICTEYMARPDSTFQGSLPLLKKYGVGAINWGFVSGKSGTIWPWSANHGRDQIAPWKQEATLPPGGPYPEPEVWFHDIYRQDGSPFDRSEIECIINLTKQ